MKDKTRTPQPHTPNPLTLNQVNRMNRGGKVQGFVAFLIVVKKTGKIVSVSPTVKEILGLECEPEELLGTSLSSLFVNTETVQQLLQLDNSNFANMVLGPSRARSDPPAVKRLLL